MVSMVYSKRALYGRGFCLAIPPCHTSKKPYLGMAEPLIHSVYLAKLLTCSTLKTIWINYYKFLIL